MSKLGDDLRDYLQADNVADRQQALAQWLVDATVMLEALKMLEVRMLARGLVWNPQRLHRLTDDGDDSGTS